MRGTRPYSEQPPSAEVGAMLEPQKRRAKMCQGEGSSRAAACMCFPPSGRQNEQLAMTHRQEVFPTRPQRVEHLFI